MMLSLPSQETLHYKELTLFIKGWIWGRPLSASSIAIFSNKKTRVGGLDKWRRRDKMKVKVRETDTQNKTKCALNSM